MILIPVLRGRRVVMRGALLLLVVHTLCLDPLLLLLRRDALALLLLPLRRAVLLFVRYRGRTLYVRHALRARRHKVRLPRMRGREITR